MGHIARNCTNSSGFNPYAAGGGGGSGGPRPGGFGGASGGGAGKTCYSCGGYGHMSRMNASLFLT
jgi:cellular nucleic acid-binding protein